MAWELCLTLVTEVSVLLGMFPINTWEAYSCPNSVPNLCPFIVTYLLTIPRPFFAAKVYWMKKHITGKLMIMMPSLIPVQSREREISMTNEQMIQ